MLRLIFDFPPLFFTYFEYQKLFIEIFRGKHHNSIFLGDNKMQCLASNINTKLRHRTRTLVPLFLQHECGCAAWVGQQEDWTGLPGFATHFLPNYELLLE